jgi:hypothetical protein
LTEENERLARERVDIEKRRPLTAEDELKVLMLHAAAQREGKESQRAGERENAALRKQIEKTNASIVRLKRKCAGMNAAKQELVDLRIGAFGDDFSLKTAMTFVSLTTERLESIMVAKRSAWGERA